ncbi:MAG: hypothetical protein JWN78_3131 [Bacteroidota bacterium]|nr:hypothetical protein [Bacteroidota bacterium]
MMEKALIWSLLNTTFRIFQNDISFKIGDVCKPLDKLLEQYNKTTWAFMTAWNPYCESLPENKNMERHLQLKKKLDGYAIFEGEAIGEDKSYPPERSFLILGIRREEACVLAEEFPQYAIVVGEKNNAAELLLLSNY